ncbi:MAG: hypothetical protein ACE361_17235 [Aureliella sp.]
MKTVSELLDEHGPPPTEVALDWAWQLHTWSQRSSESESPKEKAGAGSALLTWDQVQVGDDGLLRILANESQSDSVPLHHEVDRKAKSTVRGNPNATPLIRTAMLWTGEPAGFGAETGDVENWNVDQREIALVKATKRLASVVQKDSDEKPVKRDPVALSMASNSRSRTRGLDERKSATATKKQRFLVAASLMVGVCGLAALWPVLVGGGPAKQTLADSKGEIIDGQRAGSNLRAGPSGEPEYRSTSTGADSLNDGANSMGSVTELKLGTLPLEDSASNDAGEIGSDFRDSESTLIELSLLGNGLQIGSMSDPEVADSDFAGDAAVPENRSDSGTMDSGEVVVSEKSDLDGLASEVVIGAEQASAEAAAESAEQEVNATLAAMAERAEKDAPETEVLAASSVPGKTGNQLAPLQVATFPMIQWQKMPVQGRIREPEWEIRIAVSEGFVVRPPSAQTVRPREPARWYVQEVDADQGDTQMVVVAQVSGGRGDRIRWLIAAGSEDSPYTALPVGQRYLDLLQTNLLRFQQQLRVAVEGSKQLATMDDLPSQAKSLLRMRRKALEAKLEASENVRKLAADANRMEGWLDGQIEVHARLVDSRAAGSPPVLQFGSVEPETASRDSDAQPPAEPKSATGEG